MQNPIYANPVAFFDEKVEWSLRYSVLRISAVNSLDQDVRVRRNVHSILNGSDSSRLQRV
jgi:hypothetical protein